MVNESVIKYIIDFLIGVVRQKGHKDNLYRYKYDLIGYTNDPEKMKRYAIVIKPSGFFSHGIYGTEKAEPKEPLKTWEGIPLLFGEPFCEELYDGKTLLIHADIIASSFYLISGYEEMTKRDIRDEYGRFPGICSLPYRAGFIDRPIVDEYGKKLREIITERGLILSMNLKLENRPEKFMRVNLTHDIDQPYRYHSIRSVARAVCKEGMNLFNALYRYMSSPFEDPYFTFNKILSWNDTAKEKVGHELINTIFFIKAQSNDIHDKPNYRVRSAYMKKVISVIRNHKASLGIHFTFSAGLDPSLMVHEKRYLQKRIKGFDTNRSRHHFLCVREPEDMVMMQNAGIKHDYTMGYADVAGFRLGTCRPVRFINPNVVGLTEIVMHPLYIMDYSLASPKYMNMKEHEAEQYCKNILDKVAKHNGELNILWHNEVFSKDFEYGWLGILYKKLLRHIVEIENIGKE